MTQPRKDNKANQITRQGYRPSSQEPCASLQSRIIGIAHRTSSQNKITNPTRRDLGKVVVSLRMYPKNSQEVPCAPQTTQTHVHQVRSSPKIPVSGAEKTVCFIDTCLVNLEFAVNVNTGGNRVKIKQWGPIMSHHNISNNIYKYSNTHINKTRAKYQSTCML